MSRREHKPGQTYIDWLKSLGCVFYVPFDYNNGLKELISGTTGTIITGSSMIWDGNENAYLIKKEGSGYCAIEWHGLNMHLYSAPNEILSFTYLMEHKTTKGYGNNCAQTLYPCFYNRGYTLNVSSSSHYKLLNTWYKRSASTHCDGSFGTKLYCDGMLDVSVSRAVTRWSALTTPQLGVEWQNMGPWTTDYNNHWTYLKNFMIFNRNLSQNEIKLIQQIQ